MFAGYPESDMAKQMVLAFFGHHIEDEDVLNTFKEMKNLTKKPSIFSKIKMGVGMVYMLLFGPKNLIKTKNEYMDQIKYDMVQNIRDRKTPQHILNAIADEYSEIIMVQFKNHGACSMGSSIKNMLLRNALTGAQSNIKMNVFLLNL